METTDEGRGIIRLGTIFTGEQRARCLWPRRGWTLKQSHMTAKKYQNRYKHLFPIIITWRGGGEAKEQNNKKGIFRNSNKIPLIPGKAHQTTTSWVVESDNRRNGGATFDSESWFGKVGVENDCWVASYLISFFSIIRIVHLPFWMSSPPELRRNTLFNCLPTINVI